MTITASAETGLSISTTLPATHDAAGFAALTWIEVGELESIGDLTTSHAAVTFANLKTGKTSTLKGAEEAVTVPVVVGLDRGDAGQIAMSAARKSKTDRAFRVDEEDGTFVYFIGKVMKEGTQYGGINDVKKAPFDIGVTAPSGGEDTFIVD